MQTEVVKKKRWFDSAEEMFSMLIGLVVVVGLSYLLFNYFRKTWSGKVDVPGLVDVFKSEKQEELALVTPVVTFGPKEIGQQVVLGVQNNNQGNTYTVVYGDSLSKLAKRYYGDAMAWKRLAQLNNLKNPDILLVGQKLKIESKLAIVDGNSIDGPDYVVRTGDSLSKIALRAYGDSFAWQKIWVANKGMVVNPSIIRPGWKLVIPRGK